MPKPKKQTYEISLASLKDAKGHSSAGIGRSSAVIDNRAAKYSRMIVTTSFGRFTREIATESEEAFNARIETARQVFLAKREMVEAIASLIDAAAGSLEIAKKKRDGEVYRAVAKQLRDEFLSKPKKGQKALYAGRRVSLPDTRTGVLVGRDPLTVSCWVVDLDMKSMKESRFLSISDQSLTALD